MSTDTKIGVLIKELPMKRRKMGNAHSKHHFTKHAMRVHPRNVPRLPMRGGIRL